MRPELSSLTLHTALEQLYHREYTALDLTEAYLYQIASLNAAVNAFITPTPELAVQGAMQADIVFAKNPSNITGLALLGLPLGIKDLVDVAGILTTAGSKFYAENIPSEDAYIVTKLKLSGGVILGKTNTHEIALGVTGINPHFGPVKNPWDLSRISGGSSGGSAAAVASGMCLGAVGTDTGGSIRIPAALCGVVGLKPTYGRVSTRGVIPLSWNLDHAGFLARTVRDAALMLSVMGGFDPHDPASANIPLDDYLIHIDGDISDWKIALAMGEYIDGSDPEILAAMEEAAQVFKALGGKVEKVDVSWLVDLAQANSLMTIADGAAFHREQLNKSPELFGGDVLQRLQNGAKLHATDYALARRIQTEGGRRFETFFEQFDVLLIPTTPIAAPLIEEANPLESAKYLTRFTSAFNLTGLPALSLPFGFTDKELPLGLQIISKRWAEAKILQAGNAFEQVTRWHKRHPNILELNHGSFH